MLLMCMCVFLLFNVISIKFEDYMSNYPMFVV